MKPATKFSSIAEAFLEYHHHDPELIRIAESIFGPNADQNTKNNRLTTDARRKGGRNRWKATADSELFKEIVQQCDKLIARKIPERNINGQIYVKFCGAGKPGAGKFSRERIRKITRILFDYHASKTETAS